ncbi:MAG: FAD-dependent monooxygenase [Aeromicrobium sp.]
MEPMEKIGEVTPSWDVVVVGGGPVGCAVGLELRRHGVRCLVVERDAVTPRYPVKAMFLNPRTLEFMRRWGIAGEIRAAATTPDGWRKGVTFATSLSGKDLGHYRDGFDFRAAEEGDDVSEGAQVIMQPDTLRVMRAALIHSGADYHEGVTVDELAVEADGVVVRLTDQESGHTSTLRATYVVGADGPQSIVRSTAGIERSGRGGIGANLLLHFRVEGLLDEVGPTPAAFTSLTSPTGSALVVPIDRDTWCAHVAGYPVDVDVDSLDVAAIVRRIIGADRPFEVVYAGAYKIHERIADEYRAGRLFVAGDAAHLYAPFGGHNMNSGLGDAVNLGWKLGAVVNGWAEDALLDTYGAERRPIAVTNATEASSNVARFVGTAKSIIQEMAGVHVDAPGVESESMRRAWGDRLWQGTKLQYVARGITLDQRYVSAAVAADDDEVAPWTSMTYVPSAKPGHRLPHVWMEDGSSLYDHLGDGLTLLAAPSMSAEVERMSQIAAASGIPLHVIELSNPALRVKCGASLVLVRPDQHVAWRGHELGDATAVLAVATGRACPSEVSGAA